MLSGSHHIPLRKEIGEMIYLHCKQYSAIEYSEGTFADAIISIATSDCAKCIDWLFDV
jgi:hypothetical protein